LLNFATPANNISSSSAVKFAFRLLSILLQFNTMCFYWLSWRCSSNGIIA